MRRKALVVFSLSAVLLAVCGVAQVELKEFPLGTTNMTWRLFGDDIPPDQTLSLTITRENEDFEVQLVLGARGKAEELGLLGFLGSALGVQAPGAQVDLRVLDTVLRRPEILEVGQEYRLPGGRVLLVREQVELAGVLSLIAEYREPDGRELIELGIPLHDPVYFLPLIRVTRDGRVRMEMELVEYERP